MDYESKALSGEEIMKKLIENFKNKQLKQIEATQKKEERKANANAKT